MKTRRNKSERPARTSSRSKSALESLLVIGVILLIPLFFAIRSQAGQAANANASPVPGSSIPPTRGVVIPAVATATPTFVLPTAAPGVANGKEPPPCTFPLAQIKTVASAPENYTFSAPKVVLTALQGNIYHIAQWIPDNQQILVTEELNNGFVMRNDNEPQESISLFNPETGVSKVYATRPQTNEPPSWNPQLNAVVYPIMNYFDIDRKNRTFHFTRQVWISYGNLATAQKLADNLPQLPIAVKPDGRQTLYLSDKELSKRNGSMQVISSTPFDPTQWDYAKSRRNALPISYEMAWQPGTSLVFLYSDGATGGGGYTFILNADTGRVCELNFGGWALVAHWSSDGRYLAIIRATHYTPLFPGSDLTFLDTITGSLTTLGVIPQEIDGQHYIEGLTWAPDNRHLLTVGHSFLPQSDINENNKQWWLYLVDIISGQSVNVEPEYNNFKSSPYNDLAWSPDGSKLVVRCPTLTIDQICFIPVNNK